MIVKLDKQMVELEEGEPRSTSGCAIALALLLTIFNIIALYAIYIG